MSERLSLPYCYAVDPPVKVAVEYGFPVLILYVSLFLSGQRTPRQSALVPPALVLLMLAGGYQLFGPMVYLIVLLICTVSLTEVEPGPRSPAWVARALASSRQPGTIRPSR
jgi:hypothetical protein